jgi:hypothetical protein
VGRAADAVLQREPAIEIFEQLGAKPWLERAAEVDL